MMNKDQYKVIFSLLLTTFLIFLDFYSKRLAYIYLFDNYIINLIPNIIRLNYIENYGAAFSILNNTPYILKYVSLIASIIFFLILVARNFESKIQNIGMIFLLSGTVGNGIDRWLYGYVIDFIEIKLINFPIFNVADVLINIAIILFLFDTIKSKFSISTYT